MKVNKKAFNLSFPTYHQLLTHSNKNGHKICRKRRAKERNSVENVAEGRVPREKKTIHNFFILNKNFSTADKNNASDGGQDDDKKEEDQCAAEEDCRVKETTDEHID